MIWEVKAFDFPRVGTLSGQCVETLSFGCELNEWKKLNLTYQDIRNLLINIERAYLHLKHLNFSLPDYFYLVKPEGISRRILTAQEIEDILNFVFSKRTSRTFLILDRELWNSKIYTWKEKKYIAFRRRVGFLMIEGGKNG